MKDIKISSKIRTAAPELKVLQIGATVKNSPTSDELWKEIEQASEKLIKNYELQALNKRKSISATRSAYKKLGKDPNRYRPSAEALGRRIINGKGIYRLTTLIDAINLISIITGHSIGGFDADKIKGESLLLDAGTHEDEFIAIGRGPLNIEGLPVYRDAIGGIGTPTSDEERTKLTPETTHLLMLVNVYGADDLSITEMRDLIKDLLTRYAELSQFESKIIE